MTAPTRGLVERVLGLFLALVGLSAVGGGVYGLMGAAGVPTRWLRGSPFPDYTLPSVVLLAVVGGALVAAAAAVFARHPRAGQLALGASAILLAWIGVQVAIIGYVSWLQPVTALSALLLAALAARLPRPVTRPPLPPPAWRHTA